MGAQRIPRTNIGTSTACSVMKSGYEWHITPSIPTRDEKRRELTVRTMSHFNGDLEGNLTRLREALKAKTFEPMPVRRVYIPKPMESKGQ